MKQSFFILVSILFSWVFTHDAFYFFIKIGDEIFVLDFFKSFIFLICQSHGDFMTNTPGICQNLIFAEFQKGIQLFNPVFHVHRLISHCL